jgi:hypothetical protein
VSLVVEHILQWKQDEDMLRDQANRFAAAVAWLFACAVSSLSFIIMGWTAARCALSLPHWQVYGLMAAAVVQFVFSMEALFRGLDDLFYKKNDRRRLTRRKGDRQ